MQPDLESLARSLLEELEGLEPALVEALGQALQLASPAGSALGVLGGCMADFHADDLDLLRFKRWLRRASQFESAELLERLKNAHEAPWPSIREALLAATAATAA
jgi:hypothetical protein